ncbi:13485_t:CDS:2, partial [Dentiscutata erythropus]
MTHCLTQIRSVNKTDVVTLASSFGSLKRIMNASSDELAMCPGLGEQK